VLSTFEDPQLAFQRRGAPFTFDVEAFVKLVNVLKSTPVTPGDSPEHSISVPTFDHAMQDPVEDDLPISSKMRLVIIEGNYTLLDQKPWSGVAKACDEKFEARSRSR
jgi:pantothenate kinase